MFKIENLGFASSCFANSRISRQESCTTRLGGRVCDVLDRRSGQRRVPTCSALASQILATYPDITAATSTVQPLWAKPVLLLCLDHRVGLVRAGVCYQTGQNQAIKVGIGLPLSTADGGSSGGRQLEWPN